MNVAILSLGTNLGDRQSHLQNTLEALQQFGVISKVSSTYKTPAWGFESDDFYNISLSLETTLDAKTLLKKLLDLELEIGRIRNSNIQGYQARVIDIDLIFFNKEIIHTKDLIVPHPRMHQRLFVLIPTVEILQDYVHPIFKKSLLELIEVCDDTSKIIKI